MRKRDFIQRMNEQRPYRPALKSDEVRHGEQLSELDKLVMKVRQENQN